MTIERRFEPDPEALDRVVEILYQLLVEPPQGHVESSEPEGAVGQEASCLSQEAEG
jgi:hypothetical protein